MPKFVDIRRLTKFKTMVADNVSGGAWLNLSNGEGTDSLIQTYSGAEDSTHFGNKDYLLDEEGNPVKDENGETIYGESAAIFGEANENNAKRALLAGKLNKNSRSNALVIGQNNISSGGNSGGLIGFGLKQGWHDDGEVIVGKYNNPVAALMFSVGNGTADTTEGRSNAFEVLKDGRAKVYTTPKEDNDLVRKLELDGKISISDINQVFFNSLYN